MGAISFLHSVASPALDDFALAVTSFGHECPLVLRLSATRKV